MGMKYTLRARIDGGQRGEAEWELEGLVNDRRVWETIRGWFLGRNWEGLEGTQHRVDYEMYLEGKPIDWGVFWFTAPWSERKLILRALERVDERVRNIVIRCKHEWTASEESPSPPYYYCFWLRLVASEHCRRCGLRRRTVENLAQGTVEREYVFNLQFARKLWGWRIVGRLLREDFNMARSEPLIKLLLERYLDEYPQHSGRIQKFFADNAPPSCYHEIAPLLGSPHRERLLARALKGT
jgi:hypothetical protein